MVEDLTLNSTEVKEICVESNVWSTAQRSKKIYGFDDNVGLSENIDQLAIASSVRWYGHERMFMSYEAHYILRLMVKRRKLAWRIHGRSRSRKKVWRLVWKGKMHFADQHGELTLFRLLLGWGESGHPHYLVVQPDFEQWSLSLSAFP